MESTAGSIQPSGSIESEDVAVTPPMRVELCIRAISDLTFECSMLKEARLRDEALGHKLWVCTGRLQGRACSLHSS